MPITLNNVEWEIPFHKFVLLPFPNLGGFNYCNLSYNMFSRFEYLTLERIDHLLHRGLLLEVSWF